MPTIFSLTPAGQDIVQEVSGFFHDQKMIGRTNAALKTMHEYSALPACVPLFVIGLADHSDIIHMERLGYVTWITTDTPAG